jgi:hypothetical protein
MRKIRRLKDESRYQNHRISSLTRNRELLSKRSSQRAGFEFVTAVPVFRGRPLFWRYL